MEKTKQANEDASCARRRYTKRLLAKHWLTTVFILTLILVTGSSFAQEATPTKDPIIAKTGEFPAEKKQLRYLLEQIEDVGVIDPARCQMLIEAAIPLAERTRNAQLKGEVYYWRAWLQYTYPTSEHRRLAEEDLKISGELLRKQSNPLWLAKWHILSCYGNIYNYALHELEQPEEAPLNLGAALDNLAKSKEWVAKTSQSTSDSLQILAKCEQSEASLAMLGLQPDQEQAIAALEQAATYFQQAEDSLGLAGIYTELVRILPADSLEGYYQTAKTIYQKRGSSWLLARLNEKRGLNHQRKFAMTDSLLWFDESMLYLRASLRADSTVRANLLLNMAYNYHLKADIDSSNQLLLLDSASQAYLGALQSAKHESEIDILQEASYELSNICERLDICSDLIKDVSATYQAAIDSSKQIAAEAIGIQGNYRMQLLRQESQSRQTAILLIGGLLLTLIIGISLVVVQSKQNRIQKERIQHLQATMESRLETLRAQLNPHFISNNLNVLESHVIHSRTELASQHIVQFARLCRTILENSRKKLITWKSELELQAHYLSLVQSGAAGELDFDLTTDEGIDTAKLAIPPMLLNPFVENAVKHGYEKKQAHTTIRIQLKNMEDGRIRCEVTDDGIGRAKVKEIQERMVVQDRPSYGTTIVKEQLQQIEGAELQIEDIEHNGKVAGTRVIILFPKINLN